MGQSICARAYPGRRQFRLSLVVGALFVLGLLLTTHAEASYEVVGAFNGAPGPVLAQPSGIAVNYTGAGGVPVGTVYAVNRTQHGGEPGPLVLSYDAQGEFRQAWGWGVADENKEFERCGPAGEATHPTCKATSGPFPVVGFSGEGAGQLSEPEGIAVDQASGDVYVLNQARKHEAVQIFTATGEPVGGFGEALPRGDVSPSDSIANAPEKIHGSNYPGRIAVDASGTVYIGDSFISSPAQARTMVFEPETPGDLSTYAYTGQANDIGSSTYTEGAVALDEADNLYLANKEFISEFSPGDKTTPTCRYKVPGGQLAAMTVNPVSGEVFAISFSNGKFRQLAPCNAQGEFKEKSSFSPVSKETYSYPLAIDPALSYEPSRPAGILFSGNIVGQNQYAVEVFAPAIVHFPSIESESVSSVGATSVSLEAQINPEGSQTNYAFQFLTQDEYEANSPDEIQSLTVSASGGVFDLGYEGHRYGGEGSATLSSGSTAATALKTAAGTATLQGASGTATLKAAKGSGTVISGSTAATSLVTAEGSFEVGQQIAGPGIPNETTILAVKAGELTLSQAAVSSSANASLSAGSTTLTSLATSEGNFEVGEAISGEGIPNETTILAVKAGELTISRAPTKPGTGVAIKAGSKQLTSVTTSSGHFDVGQPIEGTGIPANTKITGVEGAKLTLSQAIAIPGTGVAISSAGPAPLAAGQSIEGPGIPAGTTILATKEGQLTLSNPATSSGTITFHVGLPFDASAGEVRHALETLPAIGSGNVSVSGGPGDEVGSNPYRIHFVSELSNLDLPLLEADSGSLSGGSDNATVQGENDGGNGFAGASETPIGGSVLGTGQEALGATASLAGLQPDTAYYYRAVASSNCNPEEEEVPCKVSGQAKRVRTFPQEAPELPDRRAYELVSPAGKAGGQVFRLEPWRSSCSTQCNQLEATVFSKQSSPDGEAVVYEGTPFATSGGGNREDEYVSRRTSSGWQSTNLTPELITTSGGETGFKAFDSRLSKGLLLQVSPSLTPGAPSEYANFYGFASSDPKILSPLLAQAAPNRGPGGGTENSLSLVYAGATPDLSHTLFEANDALTAETPSAPEAVDGGPKENNLYESVGGELHLVNVLPGNEETVPGAMFGSGNLAHPKREDPLSRQYLFDNAISADGSRIFWSDSSGQVYVREDGERTREIADHTGQFVTAAADGSQVLLSDGVLYDLENEVQTDLSEGKGGFQGIAGRSEDLSSIYFVDTAVLNGEQNEHGEVAQLGKDNLYLRRGEATRFVATLDPEDNHIGQYLGNRGDWHAVSGYRSAEASPSGRYLAFMSRAPLTGADSTGKCLVSVGKNVTAPCEEAFLYDSQTGRLACPSCNPAGRAPLGNSALPLNNSVSGYFQLQPRYLTDSGRLYFDSEDSLSTFDTNEGVEDLYQYEPEGVGTCTRSGGCVSLISAGTEAGDSNFFAADESGKNVFFVTRDQLALKDKDDLLDLYDAREDGGIASESEVARGECQGEACQVPVSPPNDPTPGSSTFEGAGNVSEPKAAKKHAKKHKKKRHVKKKHANKRAAKHNRGGAK